MKLLLTSGGICNKSIKTALRSLIDKEFFEANIVYIPTAAMAEGGHHSWLLESLNQVYDLGWKSFDVLDLAGLPTQRIAERLDKADVVYVEGGNVYWLAKTFERDGLKRIFEKFLETKVYVGVSAGSMIFSKNLTSSTAKNFGEGHELDILQGENVASKLGRYDWYIKPHWQSKEFTPLRSEDWAKGVAKKVNFPIYFIDDQTAVQVVNGKVKVISEGKWLLLNESE